MKIIKNTKTGKTILIKQKNKPIYSNMSVDSINNLFIVGAGGDVSKLNWQECQDNEHVYPIYSNYVTNEGIYGYSDSFKLQGEYLTITARGSIGKTFYRKGFFTPIGRLLYLKPQKKGLHVKYFSYLIDNLNFSGEGGVINSLTAPMIKKNNVKYFTDINQQEKIAQVLSTQEEQINNIKKLIEKLEKRNQYYAELLLSGELRVRETADGSIEFYENEEWKEVKIDNKSTKIPINWNKQNLGDLVSITTGKKNANAGSDSGSYKFFTCSKEDKLINSYSFDQEAILIAGNGIVGLSKYYKGKFDAYQRTYVLGDFKINAKYLFSFINKKFQKSIEKEIKGGVISYIKLENITNFEIIYPNNNKELVMLFEAFNILDNEKNSVNKLLEKEEKRFQWLSDSLLSGEYQIID